MVVVGNTPGIDFPRDYYKESYFYCNNHERKSSQFTTDLHTIFSGDFTILYEDK